MTQTTYSNTAVVFVSAAGGDPIRALNRPILRSTAAQIVTDALKGLTTESARGKMYLFVDELSADLHVLAGFTTFKRAISEQRLVVAPRNVNAENVVAVAIPFTYTVPWTVRDIGSKAWNELFNALAGEDSRYKNFLSIGKVAVAGDLFGDNGAMTLVTGRTHEWDGFIAGLTEDSDDGSDDDDTDPNLPYSGFPNNPYDGFPNPFRSASPYTPSYGPLAGQAVTDLDDDGVAHGAYIPRLPHRDVFGDGPKSR